MKQSHKTVLFLGIWLLGGGNCMADGIVVDKIYHPYVQPSEQELEWRTIYQDKQPLVADNTWMYQLAYGHSLGERWLGEIYLVGQKSAEQSFDLVAYEAEALWQLTEQGEFWADWGLLFEFEKEANLDKWKLSTGVLMEKEWRKWSGTVNFFVFGEWGSDVHDELEPKLNMQVRYRFSRAIEPAIEFYGGEKTQSLGPVLQGQIKTAGGRNLHWELGTIFGLSHKSPNQTLRLLLEFEF